MNEVNVQYPLSATVARKLQKKLKAKKQPVSKNIFRTGKKSSPIVVRDTDSSNSDNSDSDDAMKESARQCEHVDKSERCAPGPETYTKAEIKMFARMAQTIEDVDESKGHSNAVADFIDT